jgi:hypothetical protein
MIKKESNYLFDLIKSLSKGEKRSFKLFANYSTSGEKKYLLLFDIIESRNEYDEAKIKEKLKSEKNSTPLPVLKNYLQELILIFMRFYNSGNSVESKIRDYMSNADVLHSKGLKNFRDKTLRKAIALAKKHEKYEAVLMILNKEWNYKSIFNPKDISKEYEKVIEDLSRSLEYRKLILKVSKSLEKGEIRDQQLKKEWDDIIRNPLMSLEKEPSGYEEKYFFHHNWMRYYHRTRDYKKCCYHQEQLIKHFESRPDMLVEYKTEYMFELNGLVVAHSQNLDLKKSKEALAKLIQMQQWNLFPPEKITLIDTTLIALSNIMHGFFSINFEEVLQIAKQAEDLLKTENASSYHKAFLFLNLAKIYICTGDFEKALQWNNTILNEAPENKRDDFNVLAWIFNLIIHYELGNYDLLPSLIRSTYNFLEKRERLYKIENLILEFLRDRLPAINSRKELIILFKDLKSEFEKIIKDSFEAKAFEYFDFVIWLQSKIENTTVSELLKNKSGLSSINM